MINKAKYDDGCGEDAFLGCDGGCRDGYINCDLSIVIVVLIEISGMVTQELT